MSAKNTIFLLKCSLNLSLKIKNRAICLIFKGSCNQSDPFREAAKKSSSFNGLAIKRGEGRPLRKKELYFELFLLLSFKNKNYFTLDNSSKYGHITKKLVGRYFYLVVTIFSKK